MVRAERRPGMNDIDAITQLKARYCRFLDVKDWTA
jgi:hypothetical protein